MKYLLKINLNKVKTTNKTYVSQAFARTKNDLEFMRVIDLKRWYLDESNDSKESFYNHDDSEAYKNKMAQKHVKLTRSELESIYLREGDYAIPYGVEVVSQQRYLDVIDSIEGLDVELFDSEEDKFMINYDVLFIDNLNRNKTPYQIC